MMIQRSPTDQHIEEQLAPHYAGCIEDVTHFFLQIVSYIKQRQAKWQFHLPLVLSPHPKPQELDSTIPKSLNPNPTSNSNSPLYSPSFNPHANPHSLLATTSHPNASSPASSKKSAQSSNWASPLTAVST